MPLAAHVFWQPFNPKVQTQQTQNKLSFKSSQKFFANGPITSYKYNIQKLLLIGPGLGRSQFCIHGLQLLINSVHGFHLFETWNLRPWDAWIWLFFIVFYCFYCFLLFLLFFVGLLLGKHTVTYPLVKMKLQAADLLWGSILHLHNARRLQDTTPCVYVGVPAFRCQCQNHLEILESHWLQQTIFLGNLGNFEPILETVRKFWKALLVRTIFRPPHLHLLWVDGWIDDLKVFRTSKRDLSHLGFPRWGAGKSSQTLKESFFPPTFFYMSSTKLLERLQNLLSLLGKHLACKPLYG